jgi:uncharacterized membrane protein HdeD (DUF308 family)
MSKPEKQPQYGGMIKTPNSLRAAQIVIGIVTLALAGLVLAFPGFALFLIVIWLSISLLVGGIEGVIVGAGARFLSKGGRAISIGLGILAIGLSVAVLAFPGATALTLSLLLSIALLFLGAGSIAKGISEKRMPGWARAMLVVVGAISVAVSIPVMAFPMLGVPILFALVASALIINGASYVVAGITGAVFRPIYRGASRDTKSSWESEAA